MKLNNATEKAMAIMAYITVNNNSLNRSIDIAEKLNLSDSYTKKILRKLVLGKLIDASSGNNGGYTLAKDSSELNLLMLIEAVEGKVVTYPQIGILNQFFHAYKQSDELSKEADYYLAQEIQKADELWRQQIATITLKSIIDNIDL